MFNSVFVLQIKHILTKKNFEMYFRAGKTNKFSVFHVENGEIQSMLWLYVFFNLEIHVIWRKNKLFLRFVYVFNEIVRFFCYKRLILSKLLMCYANKCLILSSFCKLNTFWLKRTLKCTSELEKLINFQFFMWKTVKFSQCYGFMCVSI